MVIAMATNDTFCCNIYYNANKRERGKGGSCLVMVKVMIMITIIKH